MMSAAWLGLGIFAALLASAAAGVGLRALLQERHRSPETTDHVRMVISILVTFTALILSLLLSEVKGSFDHFDSRLRTFAGDLANLDSHLREYGDDAQPIRAILRKYVAATIADSWRNEPAPPGDYPRFGPAAGVERAEFGALLIKADAAIHRLEPLDGFHQRMAALLSNRMDDALSARRRLIETARATISWPLLLAMCGWLGVVFGVFGLLAPRNAVVNATIVICAFCVASAIFVIREFDQPLGGFISVSSGAMRETLAGMDAP